MDVTSTDVEVSMRFYSSLFEWTHHELEIEGAPGYALLHGIEPAAAAIDPFPDKDGPVWTVFASAEDVASIATRHESLGGTVTFQPMPMGDLGRIAMVRDPLGAILGLWQPDQLSPTVDGSVHGRLAGAELRTPSGADSAIFYQACFGWSSQQVDSATWTMDAGGVPVTIREVASGPAQWYPVVAVDDLDRSVSLAGELGGSREQSASPSSDVPVADPLGARLLLRPVVS